MSSRVFPIQHAHVVINSLNTSAWILYLIVLSLISFSTLGYKSVEWLRLTSVIYALAGLSVLCMSLKGRGNIRGLAKARVVLTLLVLIVVWQFLQINIPLQSNFIGYVFGDVRVLDWLQTSGVISIVPLKSKWLMLSNVFEIVLFSLTILLVDTRIRLKQLLALFMAVGLVHALLAIMAKFGDIYLIDIRQLDGHFDAARGLFVNRNHLAGFCSLTLVGGLALLLRAWLYDHPTRGIEWLKLQLQGLRVVYLFVVLISFITIILAQSRAAFLGLFVGSVIAMLLLKPRNVNWSDLARLWIPTVITVVALLIVFGEDLLLRFGGEQFSLGERYLQWWITLQAITQEPVFGYGGGSYAIVFQVYREYAELRYVIYDQAHNHYLHLWLEQGIIGLLLWLGVLYAIIIHAVKAFKRTSSKLVKAVLCAILVVIFAALLQSLVDYNLQIMNMRSYFFVIIALLFAAPTVHHKSKMRREVSEEDARYSESHHSYLK